jgi:hypothetical protein
MLFLQGYRLSQTALLPKFAQFGSKPIVATSNMDKSINVRIRAIT